MGAPGEAASGAAVLVVDDNDLVRSMCDLVLRRHGFETTTFERGADAVRWLGEHDVDVVVTDVVLPGDVSGAQLVQLVAAREPRVGVVAMSGHADIAERVGADATVLPKPFSVEELVAAVQTAARSAGRDAGGPS